MPKRRKWRRSSVFITSFEDIVHIVLVFLWLTLNMELLVRLVLSKNHTTVYIKNVSINEEQERSRHFLSHVPKRCGRAINIKTF